MALSYYLLLVAFFLAVLQFIFPLIVGYRKDVNDLRRIYRIAGLQFLAVSLAFFSLAFAFINNDFSFAYVAENSNRYLPWIYRFCAVWGGHEGSILLWVFILNIWTISIIFYKKNLEVVTSVYVIAVLGLISAGFLLFLVSVSNPFVLAPVIPTNGQDLNPLLQDPGLVVHPPLLYMGYVGFSVTFAFAISALLRGRLDSRWAKEVRPWALAAWCFLTWGIVSGSWWAYRVLGWGGWWFWDPVENASLLPWLSGTAFIHSLFLLGKRDLLKNWICLLAILTFALSLFGTFIVRSGILVSVHAFAIDPWRGVFMLVLLGLLVGAALVLYAVRIKQFKVKPYRVPLLSKEMLLISNNILLSVSIFTILLGTLYPLIIEVLGLGKLSVGAPYFNCVFIPFAFLILFLMGIASLLNGDRKSDRWIKKIIYLLMSAFAISFLLVTYFFQGLQWKVVFSLALSLWIIVSMLHLLWQCRRKKMTWKQVFQSRGAMLLAHLGVAISAIGIILSSAYSVQRDVRMKQGDSVQLGSYQFKLQAIRDVYGPNYTGVAADLKLLNATNLSLTPQLRYYPAANIALSKPAVDAGVWRDVYIALAEPLPRNTWALRFYVKPFIRWIWAGGMLMILGGIYSIRRSKPYTCLS